jgi:fructose-1,6-bisphosphatase/inositol monophosphatase family enzyme
MKLASLRDDVFFKADGSPVTRQEREIEALLREHLVREGIDADVVGEETGGTLPARGTAVAIDPVDGTWSLVNRSESHVVSLAVCSDGTPVIGGVLNPSTAELAYASRGGDARLLQLSAFGEADDGSNLPLEQVGSRPVLVNTHPNRMASSLIEALYQAWAARGVRMVRSSGGAPSWGFVDAAKGSFTYVNLWDRSPAAVHDLAAGTLIVRGAGGDVTDLHGEPIDPIGHTGPFIAGTDPAARERVAEIARGVLG